MHEYLMYAKWATPILLEIMFTALIIFFWERGRKWHPVFFFISGIAYSFAILSKLSAVYFSFSLALFFIIACYVKKELRIKEILLFISGVSVVLVISLLVFYLPYFDHKQYESFSRVIFTENLVVKTFSLKDS